MSQQIKLKVGGFGYAGQAGEGPEFLAYTSGSEADAVWFRVDGTNAALSKLTGFTMMFGDYAGKAYLSSGDRSRLRDLSVSTSEQDVRGAGMGNYVLWLDDDGNGAAPRRTGGGRR